jgi:cobalt-zinc-cadmium efflux system outer membrane protein
VSIFNKARSGMCKCIWKRFVWTALILLAGASVAAAQEMTQEQALGRFEKESQQMRAIDQRVAVVRAETRAWSLPPNPAATVSREDAAGAADDFVLVQQSLPVNGRLGLLRSAGSAQVNATEAEVSYQRLLLRSDFRAAFYALLLSQQRVAVIEAWMKQLHDLVRILQEREQAGEGSAFDRMRGQRELSDAAANLASQQVALAQARSRLASFLAPGTDPSTLQVRGDFAAGQILPPFADVVAKAQAVRGDYVAGERQLERFALEERAVSRVVIPDPVITGGMKSSTFPGRSGKGYVLSVTIPLPLFNHGQADRDRLRATEERTRSEQAARRQQIESDVRAAYDTAKLRREAAADLARQMGNAGAEMARIAQVAYQEGERGILELLDAHRVAMQSGMQALELSWLSKQAEIDLNRYAGEEVLP